MRRGAYIDRSESRSCAHDGEVVGVACDSTNTLMISAGYQGDIKVYISCLKAICNCHLLNLINRTLWLALLHYTGNPHFIMFLQVWDFKERELKSRWEIGSSIVKIVYHRYNGKLSFYYLLCSFIPCVCVCF